VAQEKSSRATFVDNEGLDAFTARVRCLADLCGKIRFQGTMKQQQMKGLPEYVWKGAFEYNKAPRSYQQMSTYVAEKYRAASVNHVSSLWEENDTATLDMVAVPPSIAPGFV